jgi:hypothetical protein
VKGRLPGALLPFKVAIRRVTCALGQCGERQGGEGGGGDEFAMKVHDVLLGLLIFLICIRSLLCDRQVGLGAREMVESNHKM